MLRHTERMNGDPQISDRAVIGVVVLALVLGVGLYNVIPIGSSSRGARAAAVSATPAAAEPAATAGQQPGGSLPSSQVGTVFGSAIAALEGGQSAADLQTTGSSGTDVPSPPSPPPVPAAECPTDAANDAYDSVAGPLGAALGEQLPQDHLRVLTQIAAGCSTASPATPLIGIALDLARLVPPTGLPNQDLSAIPAIEVPALPAPVVEALEPLREQIMEGCGTVGLLGVLLAVLPGAAGLPISGSDLADALVPAQSLCKNFEETSG